MSDRFENFTSTLDSPATHLTAASPSDTTNLVTASRAINVATSGTVRVTTVGGSTETIFIAAGIAFPVRATRVWQTGTTATGLVVMY